MPSITDLIDYQLLPALPGYNLWWVSEDELLGPHPVTGWIVQRHRRINDKSFFWGVIPITVFDVADPEYVQEYVIQYPDGQVEFPEDCTVADLPAARDYLRTRYKSKNEADGTITGNKLNP